MTSIRIAAAIAGLGIAAAAALTAPAQGETALTPDFPDAPDLTNADFGLAATFTPRVTPTGIFTTARELAASRQLTVNLRDAVQKVEGHILPSSTSFSIRDVEGARSGGWTGVHGDDINLALPTKAGTVTLRYGMCTSEGATDDPFLPPPMNCGRDGTIQIEVGDEQDYAGAPAATSGTASRASCGYPNLGMNRIACADLRRALRLHYPVRAAFMVAPGYEGDSIHTPSARWVDGRPVDGHGVWTTFANKFGVITVHTTGDAKVLTSHGWRLWNGHTRAVLPLPTAGLRTDGGFADINGGWGYRGVLHLGGKPTAVNPDTDRNHE